jgi:hydrogenase maturation protease
LDDNPIGTIRLITPRFAQDVLKAMSMPDIGLKDMVGGLQLLGKMPVILLFVVSIESLPQQALALTDKVEIVIPDLIGLIKKLVAVIPWDNLVKKVLVPAD